MGIAERWTQADQKTYDALAEKRERTLRRDEDALHTVTLRVIVSMGDKGKALPGGFAGDLARAMQNDAGSLRDALAPFDSGVRGEAMEG